MNNRSRNSVHFFVYFSGILTCRGRWIPVKVPRRDTPARVVPGDPATPTPSPPVPEIASIVFISLSLFTWLICVLCCHEEVRLTTASRHQIHDMIYMVDYHAFFFFFYQVLRSPCNVSLEKILFGFFLKQNKEVYMYVELFEF